MSTLELARAKFALEKVEQVKNDSAYRRELQDLPARLHSAGLGQTVASLLAAAERNSSRKAIYGWLEEWLRKPPIRYPAGQRLIDCIVGNLPQGIKPASYMAASREARALATWLKKFAEAFILKDAKG